MTTAQNNTSTTANTHQGGLVPRLRFPEFEGEWNLRTLSDLFGKITNGKSNAQDHVIDGKYPLFDRSEEIKRSHKYEYEGKAVIIPGEGMRFQPRYFDGQFDLHQRAYALLDTKENALFAFYGLDHRKKTLAQKAVQSTVLSLRLPIINKFELPTPTLPEQQKIADCLSSLDELIAAEDQKLATLKVHKKGLMQELFPREGESVPQIRFPEFEGAGEWEVKRLGEVCRPRQWPTISSTDLLAEGYPVYGANGFIGFYNEYNHAEETIAVTCRGATCGTVSLIPGESYITGNSMCLDDIDESSVSLRYLYQFIMNRGFSDVISGSAQPQIVGSAISKIPVACPSLTEQQKIAAVLSSLDDRITAQAERIEALRVHKKGLMQGLFPVMEG